MGIKRHTEKVAGQIHPKLCNCGNKLQVATECFICYEKRTGIERARNDMLLGELERIGLVQGKDESRHEFNMRCKDYYMARSWKGSCMAKAGTV